MSRTGLKMSCLESRCGKCPHVFFWIVPLSGRRTGLPGGLAGGTWACTPQHSLWESPPKFRGVTAPWGINQPGPSMPAPGMRALSLFEQKRGSVGASQVAGPASPAAPAIAGLSAGHCWEGPTHCVLSQLHLLHAPFPLGTPVKPKAASSLP